MKHEFNFEFIDVDECDRGCCGLSIYKVFCLCGHDFKERTTCKKITDNLEKQMINHRLDIIETRLDSVTPKLTIYYK